MTCDCPDCLTFDREWRWCCEGCHRLAAPDAYCGRCARHRDDHQPNGAAHNHSFQES